MELNKLATKQSKEIEKCLKRPRPSFDDQHWVQFFEEANTIAQESYRTIRSFEIFKAEYLSLQLQQTTMEEVNAVALRRLKQFGLSDRASKGFKRMLGTPTKKPRLDQTKQTPNDGNTIEKKVFKPILVNGAL